MRNLPVPNIDALTYFDKISGEKRGIVSKRLVKLRTRVVGAYAAYLAKSKALQKIVPENITGVRAAALVHAYEHPTKTMKVMRGKLLEPDLDDFDECPYCGIGEPRTLDHYLPKETYPEFSILPVNLIPICNVCNTSYKGKKFLSAAGRRMFMHSYYDAFPVFDFLSVKVDVNAKIELKFSSCADPANAAFSQLFARHFVELGLGERFIKKSAAEISRKRSSLRRFYAGGNFKKVSRELQREADDLRSTLSGNHWKVALYDGLAKSKDFCDGGFSKLVEKSV
ncbi:HNH endonuclease [Burkholderia cepacia]|uniref:HNH endonuclease n=1 Tax=Burkholderia cepacia TaxID=292 RepID=UPI001CF0E339|nr:hypothetical protein [Burkholderia cepacia]MCA8323801.1 hypothetical protein [Burkholderia cepacia]